MQNAIRAEIKRLARRAFLKAERLSTKEQKYRRQFEKRTGLGAGLPSMRPKTALHRHFDPKYCARNANFLAKTIWHKVINETYEPIPAIKYEIPKPDGSRRGIMAFAIPDAALANVVLRRSRQRNIKRLSPSSFAYHPDKNVFDAIIALQEFESKGKMFAVQIDFEKYFDNIPRWYLIRKISDERSISLTPHERYIFKAFLVHRYAMVDDYTVNKFKKRVNGTPQGSSVSLLLANLANHDLDTALSKSAGRFVRFADDVVALCDTYTQAQEIEACFINHCKASGLTLNARKSPGIAIISANNQEMRTYPGFDYLGYRFSTNGLAIPDKTVDKIKARASRLINLYLIYYLRFGFNKTRASQSKPSFDWDLLGLLYELRNSLYGGLSEAAIEGFIAGGQHLPRMKGLMGFYCLLEDPTQLKSLDGWLLSAVRRAMVNRNAILQHKYSCACPTPTNKELATGAWLDPAAWRDGPPPEPRMPSFVRGWRAARKHFFTYGLENVAAPRYGAYSDVDELFDY